MLVAIFTVKPVSLGWEHVMNGKRILEAPPPFCERGKRILIQRDHATFAAPCLGLSHREESLQ
jgi:hypothetical protein